MEFASIAGHREWISCVLEPTEGQAASLLAKPHLGCGTIQLFRSCRRDVRVEIIERFARAMSSLVFVSISLCEILYCAVRRLGEMRMGRPLLPAALCRDGAHYDRNRPWCCPSADCRTKPSPETCRLGHEATRSSRAPASSCGLARRLQIRPVSARMMTMIRTLPSAARIVAPSRTVRPSRQRTDQQ